MNRFMGKGARRPGKALLAGATASVLVAGVALTVGNGNAAVRNDEVAGLTSLYRLNVGGGEFTDQDGRKWEADQFAEGGASHTVAAPIVGTSNDGIFQSERWGMTGYDVPAANGSYRLRLMFAEVNPTSGRRVFTIKQGSRTLLSNFDISREAKPFTAVWKEFNVEVTDGALHLDFSAKSNSASLAGLELLRPSAAAPTTPRAIAPTTTKPTAPATATPTKSTTPVTAPSVKPIPTPTVKNPSGEAMPIGDLPGFKQIFTDDFVTPAALGQFPGSAYGSTWDAYDGFKDTARAGTYDKDKVLSVKNGTLDMFLHTENGVPLVSAPTPRTSGKGSSAFDGQLYGRYSVRFRADPVQGYKTAWLLWPDSNEWNDGEIDFPEGGLTGNIHAFHHCVGNASNNCLAVNTTAKYSDWHTATIEWIPGRVTFILDGKQIGTSTKNVPTKGMHWMLQTETDGKTPPAGASGHVQIDWVSVWARR